MKNLNLFFGLALTISLFLICCGIPMATSTQKKAIVANKIIHVFPVHILTNTSNFDTLIAKQITSYINESGWLKASFNNTVTPVNSKWSANEAKMFSASGTSFINFLNTKKRFFAKNSGNT